MSNTFNRKQLGLTVACALALGILSGMAQAQAQDEHALATSSGGAPVMSGFGLCVHSSFGPAPRWTQGCHAYVPMKTVTFDANILFDSDQSTLRPLGRDKLDQFAKEIRGLESPDILAIGYADRMGTSESNQVLSQQRVDAVKSYLVGTGIAAERVQTRARGETRPSTLAGECTDAKNSQNVACMQPDRHVFIEVSGTRPMK